MRTIPAEKPTAIKTEQPYVERNYGRELNQLAARAERAEAHAAQLAEALRKLIEASDKAMWLSMQVEDVLTLPRNKAKHVLAAYESEVRQ